MPMMRGAGARFAGADDLEAEQGLGAERLRKREIPLEVRGATVAADAALRERSDLACDRPRLFERVARLVAEWFDWQWELEPVAWEQGDHPWSVRQPVFTDTTRLRQTLGVTQPDPVAATLAQLDWLWANRESLAQRPA